MAIVNTWKRSRVAVILVLVLAAAGVQAQTSRVAVAATNATADPAGATTLDPGISREIHWHGTVGPGAGNVGGLAWYSCDSSNEPPLSVDTFQFNLTGVSPDYYKTHQVRLLVRITWTTANYSANDLGLTVWHDKGDHVFPPSTDPDLHESHQTGSTFEQVVYTNPIAAAGTQSYHAAACSDENASNQDYQGVARLTIRSAQAADAVVPGPQRFSNYIGPDSVFGRDVINRAAPGEPSIGANPETGAVMYGAGTTVARAKFNDTVQPPSVQWTNVTPAQQQAISEDTILFLDQNTGRTFFSELHAEPGCSMMSYSDNDGTSWSPSVGCGLPAGVDHQTVGGGRFASPDTSINSYPDAVYYCAHSDAFAQCSTSNDGGMTFNSTITPVPSRMYLLAPAPGDPNSDCRGLHGHLRVGPDGAAYVPNDLCGLLGSITNGEEVHQAAVVSTDNGRTWKVKTVPTAGFLGSGSTDPSVAIGPRGTAYFGFVDADGHPKVATSRNHGDTWTDAIDVGVAHGIQNAAFSEVITGDDNRAAFAWLGTTSPGDTQAMSHNCSDPENEVCQMPNPRAFLGSWDLYVSTTHDGGVHWQTVDATPGDPVQRGCIWTGGGSHPCRNMLDFNDITVDKQGRVLVAYTDGCTTDATYSCDRTNRVDDSGCGGSEGASTHSTATCTYGREAAMVRQTCGRGLYAAYDGAQANGCFGQQTNDFNPNPNPAVVNSAKIPLPLTATPAGGVLPEIPPWAWLAVPSAVMAVAARRRRRRPAR
ncbi:MAG: sialidase family protein [Candidatus Dormibacteria bacterium]